MKNYSTRYFLVQWDNVNGIQFMQVGPFWTDEALQQARDWFIRRNPSNCVLSEPWEYPVMDHIGE